jgi:membrane-bound lytic murein transglycosylase D
MATRHRVDAVLIGCALAAFLALNGCGPAKSQQFRTAFTPPTPRSPEPEPEALPSEPPVVPKDYIKELPNLFPAESALARGSEIDNRLRRAEEKFETGRRAYQDGKLTEARRAFDQAVDVLLGASEGAPDRAKLERRLDQMVETIYRYDVNGLGAAEDADKVVFDKSPLDGMLEMTFPTDPQLKPKVVEEIHGTASQIPLDESDAVLSYIHFFSGESGKRILTAGLRRAGRYRPLIERVLEEEKVPQELIYLAQAESGFLPRAVSYKQAVGMWQFVAWRGNQYGLKATKVSDDRLDPEKATRAAARHLRDLYKRFGDWYLAMAAYNCGPGCVDRAVQRTGHADFWTLRNLNVLPTQTQNYVPLILAITIMAKNPKDYGLDRIEIDRPIEYDSVKLAAPTNLALIADALERPVSEIRDLNPALLKGVAPPGYDLRIPKGSSHPLLAALDSIPANRRASSRLHRVERGESLAVIARRYRTPANVIASANKNTMVAPEAGDVLLIPAAYQENSSVSRPATSRKTLHSTSANSRARSVSSRRTSQVSKQRVSSKVLNRRAPVRHLKTASIGSAAGGQ